jgi:hypothetical protein
MEKIETQEQFDEYVNEVIPQSLFHVMSTDIDDESGAPLDQVILVQSIAAHPEVLKFKSLQWFMTHFLM